MTMLGLFALWAALLVLALVVFATGIVGDDLLAPALTDITAATAIKARLYTNSHTPAVTDTVASYTEATFTGYAAVTLGGWGAAAVTAHIGKIAAADIDFAITAGTQNVYGIYFTDAAGTLFYGAVADPAGPVTLDASATNHYVVSVALTDQSM